MSIRRKLVSVLVAAALLFPATACDGGKKTEDHGDFKPPPPTPLKNRTPPGGGSADGK